MKKKIFELIGLIGIIFILAMIVKYCSNPEHKGKWNEPLFGQEIVLKELIYEYKNVKDEYLGDNHWVRTIEPNLPYKIYRFGNDIIIETEIGNIEYTLDSVDVKNNYKIQGKDKFIVDTLWSNSDEISYIIKKSDFSYEVKSDTAFFRKGNKLVFIQSDFRVYDYDNQLLSYSLVLDKDKIKLKYNRKDKTKLIMIDPTSQFVAGTDSVRDNMLYAAVPATNYGTLTIIAVGGQGAANKRFSVIDYVGARASILAIGTIDSARWFFYSVWGGVSGAQNVWAVPLKIEFDELTATWNSHSGEGDSILGINSDTLTNGLHNSGWDSLNMTRYFQDTSNTGWLLRDDSLSTENDDVNMPSKENGTPANRHYLNIYYTSFPIIAPKPVYIVFGTDTINGKIDIDSINNNANARTTDSIALLFDNGLWYSIGNTGYSGRFGLTQTFYPLTSFDNDSIFGRPDDFIGIKIYVRNEYPDSIADTFQVYQHGYPASAGGTYASWTDISDSVIAVRSELQDAISDTVSILDEKIKPGKTPEIRSKGKR